MVECLAIRANATVKPSLGYTSLTVSPEDALTALLITLKLWQAFKDILLLNYGHIGIGKGFKRSFCQIYVETTSGCLVRYLTYIHKDGGEGKQ